MRSKTNFPLLLEYARKWVLPLGTDDATEALKCKQVSHIKHSIYYVLLLSFRFSMSHLLLQCVLLSIKGLLSRLIDTATLCFGLSSLLQGIVCSLIHYLRYWKERDPWREKSSRKRGNGELLNYVESNSKTFLSFMNEFWDSNIQRCWLGSREKHVVQFLGSGVCF